MSVIDLALDMVDRVTSSRPEVDPSKIDHVLISLLKPSPENDKLYRPVNEDDPEVRALARSIKEHGVKEPLVVTLDDYILSGHRRRAACILAGVYRVPVRYEPVVRGDCDEPKDPRFLTLLATYNRQRVKSFDEVAREEAIAIDPKEAHRRLRKHRQEKAAVSADTLQIRDVKHRALISKAKEPFLTAIWNTLHELRAYWPLTDRTVHYRLLNAPPLIHASKPDSVYKNDLRSYKSLCELLTRARLAGRISWLAIEDTTRPVETWSVWNNVGPFLSKELRTLFKGYYRNLQQSQPNHIEIVAEKNTLENIISPVAGEFCIPYTVGRGYSSIDPRKKMLDRFEKSGKEKLVLLVLSDFDAEGEDIPHSFARSMRDDFGIENVSAVKVALTHQQVQATSLHPNRLKEKSSRAPRFRELYGENTFELEAIPPPQLQDWLRGAIDSVLDVAAFNNEVDREAEDAARLEGLRERLAEAISGVVKNWCDEE